MAVISHGSVRRGLEHTAGARRRAEQQSTRGGGVGVLIPQMTDACFMTPSADPWLRIWN